METPLERHAYICLHPIRPVGSLLQRKRKVSASGVRRKEAILARPLKIKTASQFVSIRCPMEVKYMNLHILMSLRST